MSVQTETAIRPAERADLDAIVTFMLQVFPTFQGERDFATRFFAWKYFDLEGRDTGYPPAFLAEDERGVMGFIGSMPFMLRYQGQHIPTGWVADWHLLDHARGRGLGRALLRASIDTVPAMACVDGSQDAQRLYASTGFQVWEGHRSWLHVCRPLAYEWPRRAGGKKALALYRAARHALATRRAQSAAERATIHLGSAVDVGVAEPFFQQQQANGLVRDSSYLAWLTRCPGANTSLHLLLVDRQPVGYVFLQHDQDRLKRKRGRIIDLFLQPDALPWLAQALRASVQHLRQTQHVDYVDIVAAQEQGDHLHAAGFQARKVYKFWLKTDTACHSSDSWALSLTDKDNAFRGGGLIP